MDNFIEVFKWIGIVLAASFIGYFGRYLAMSFIDKMRKKNPLSPSETPPSPEARLKEALLKFEKKKAKAEAKRLKKADEK